MYPILTYSLQHQWCSSIHCQNMMLKPNSSFGTDWSELRIHDTYTTPKLASFPGSPPKLWQQKVPGKEATYSQKHTLFQAWNMSYWEQVTVYSFIKISKLPVTPTELKPDATMHHSQPVTVEERLCQICPCGRVQDDIHCVILHARCSMESEFCTCSEAYI